MTNRPLQDEQDLLARIADGDQSAFTEIFRYYQKYVYIYGKKITRSHDLSVEIVQDIFIKIWIDRSKLSLVEHFGPYLNRIVRNHSLNVLRSLAIKTKSDRVLGASSAEADNSTLQLLSYNDSLKLLNEAVENLPPQQRIVFNLCHIEGMKHSDAASHMNISVETVHAHMKQALKKIRTHFNRNGILYPIFLMTIFKL